jgi:hypothetical protein
MKANLYKSSLRQICESVNSRVIESFSRCVNLVLTLLTQSIGGVVNVHELK